MSTTVSLPPFWTVQDKERVNSATTMAELGQVALGVLRRMPPPIVQVCGPLTTGGAGSLEANIARFRAAIAVLKRRGWSVFDQIPFQETMIRIGKSAGQAGYCWPILWEFYQPVFRSGLINRAFFLPGWQSSTGASWEHRMVTECLILIEEFPDSWFAS